MNLRGLAITLLGLAVGLPAFGQLTITTVSPLPPAMVGISYSQVFQTTGGTGAISYSPTGTVPAGMSIVNGILSGTPLAVPQGGSAAFTLTATDSATPPVSVQKQFTISVLNGLTITNASLPAGQQGSSYSGQLVATGGSGSLLWSVTGLPNGLVLNSSSGAITGSPTVAGSFPLTITVSDTVNPTQFQTTKNLTLTVSAGPVSITTASPLPNAAVGTPYTQTLQASGGAGLPYTWTVATGSSLPSWLQLVSATGVLSGTPTQAGTVSFTIRATDSASGTITKDFALTVLAGLSITTASPLPAGNANQPYPAVTFAATGGTGSGYTWGLATGSGPLPAGLVLSAGGVLNGTPTQGGTFPFTVQVTDSSTATTTKQFSLTINTQTLTIGPASLLNWTVGRPYSQTLTVTGATGTVAWSLADSTNLPEGLILSAGGILSGSPTTPGTVAFTVRATDTQTQATTTRAYTVAIAAVPEISTTTLAPGALNSTYNATLAVTGGTAPFVWALTQGNLPTGVALAASTGVLSGTPLQVGSFPITVQCTDSAGAFATRQLTLAVSGNSLVISPAALPNAIVNVPYSGFALSATGGSGQGFQWSISAGALPAGMNLSASGILSGTPTAAGTFTFTARVQDSGSNVATREFALIVTSSQLAITTSSPLPQGITGVPYLTTFAATGGSGAGYSWAASGALPAGLTLTSNGQLSGTPTAAGSFTILVQVTDSVGNTASRQYGIAVAGTPLTITTTSPLPDATIGLAYSIQLQASGGASSNYTFALAGGTLPVGLNLLPTGVISGTPTQASTQSFVVQVSDGAGGFNTKPFSLTAALSNLTVTTNSLAPAARNAPYSVTLNANGGSLPYQWSVFAGLLPAGLSLNASTGQISGTPTTSGTFNFTVQVRDTNNLTATANLSLQVVQFAITTTGLPDATVGAAYQINLSATGGTSPLTWSVVSGSSLPSGLTLNASSGVLSGTPTQAGQFTFTVQAVDAASSVAQQALTLRVTSTPVILTEALPAGTVASLYEQTLTAAGGTAPYSWSVTSGALPVGVSLNASTGIIRGTPSTTTGSPYSFVIQVRDATGATSSKPLSIVINPAGAGAPSIVTAATLPAGTPSAAYSVQLAATGGTPPYTWTLLSGALPAGLQLSSTGLITGTPTQSGAFSFNVRVTDQAQQTATRQFSLNIGQSTALSVATLALPNGIPNASYTQTLTATGGSGTGYAWSIVAGALPQGFSINPTSGVISGITASAGAFNFTVRVTDSQGSTAIRSFTLTIATTSALQIVNTALPDANTGTFYSQALIPSGGSGQGYSFEVIAGAANLSSIGLTLSASGLISGSIPATAAAGPIGFTVRMRDSTNAFVDRAFSITVTAGQALVLDTITVTPGRLATPYTFAFSARGGTPPYNWSIANGIPPPGVTLSPSTGILAGTPTTPGSYIFTLQVRDAANPAQAVNRQFSVQITTGALAIDTATVPPASIGTAYNATMTASGGTAPYTWSVAGGQLPPGLTLSSTGLLSGLPSTPGSYLVILQVTDATASTALRQFSITVSAPLSITSAELPNGTIGTNYNQTLTASGGTPPYTWALIGGGLPQGVTLNPSTGVLTGTPQAQGTFLFTTQVTDATASTALRQLTLVIGTSLSITTTSLPNASTGISYSQTLAATGGVAPLQWSVTAGSLPAGLSLNSATGAITGVPTGTGQASFTVRVQDSAGASATRQLTLNVITGLSITTPTALPQASQDTAYSQTLAATGGTAPYRWQVTIGTLPTGLLLNAETGEISGTPTLFGNFSFIVQVTDAQQQTAVKGFTLAVSGRVSITTASLPNATVRAPYSERLAAAGGVPPYTWSLAPGGTPPIGITVNPDGVISGTPSSAGVFPFTVEVVDSQNNVATRSFTLNVVASLSITSASPLNAGVAGVAYAQALAATGGQSPYSWSLAGGSLPPGLTLSSAGVLNGTPSEGGAFEFTVQVTDNARSTATASFTLRIATPEPPSLSILGISDTVEPRQQPRISLSLSGPYPLPLSGVLTLSFATDAVVPLDDPAVVFSSNGARRINFTIPANSTQAQLPAGFAMQTGTVAGTIQLSATLQSSGQDLTPSPAPMVEARLQRTAPVIVASSLRATRVDGGLQVSLSGYATSRQVTSATFRFTPAPGSSLQTTELTIPLTDASRTWYQSDQSRPFGSQFTLNQRFNVTGDLSAIRSVTVTLVNDQGSSQSATADF